MFSRLRTTATVCVVVLGTLASASAFAQHRYPGARFGFYFADPLYTPFYYPPPLYYPPAFYPSAAYGPPPAPPEYVERGDIGDASQAAPSPPQAKSYWYYCMDSKTYYPYAKTCPSLWQQVPAPPSPPAD